MSVPYRAVVLNSTKLFNDGVMLTSMAAYLFVFMVVSLSGSPRPDLVEAISALARAFGTLTLILLHFILAIGPLARLHPAFVPFIQVRRHMGVTTFFVALTYALLTLFSNYTAGAMNPIGTALIGNMLLWSLSTFPFEIFGVLALLILAAMAFTSHDFWIAYLGLERWKKLHMLIYAAYLLVPRSSTEFYESCIRDPPACGCMHCWMAALESSPEGAHA
jgi:sulfoxide reductase heme-binding subunit YedZ